MVLRFIFFNQKHRQFRKQVPRQERISQAERAAAQSYYDNMRAFNQEQDDYMMQSMMHMTDE